MSKIVFLNDPNTVYDGKFSQIGANQVRLVFTDLLPTDEILLSGFNLINEHNGRIQTKRTDYIYKYRTYEDNPNMVELCNDNIPWVEPEITVQFNADFGGTLEGKVKQTAKNYEELIIPTPIADENYAFVGWNPEIPTSGKIENDATFDAEFSYMTPLNEYKDIRQTENKENLAIFLKENPILWIDGLYYGVTQEDQNEMNLDLSIYQLKQSIGDTEWKLQWHSIKSDCRDFTLEEFIGLLNAIIEFVYPYRQLEMQYKEAIYSATTKEEIDAIELVYELEVQEETTEEGSDE